MASNTKIRGLTLEINGDTSGLQKSLRAANSEIKSTQSQLKDVEKLLKMDPGNVELLEQKQKLLGDAVSETAKKLETLKEAQERFVSEGGDVNSDGYAALQREIIATESSLKKATKEARNFDAGIAKAQATLSKVSKAADTVAQKTKGMSTAAAGALAGIGGMALKSVQAADELNTLSAQTGFTTEEIQKFQYAADLVDVSFEDIAAATKKLTKSMNSDAEGTAEAFDKIGVATRNADGSLRDSNEVFYEVLAALSGVTNETERDALAMQLLGTGATNLATIIDDGGAALKEYGEEAENLGVILDQETLDSLNDVNDELDKIKAKANGSISKAGAEAMQALAPIFEQVIDKISALLEWIGKLDEGQLKTITTVLAVVAAISPIAGLISSISGAVSGFLGFMPTLQKAGAAIMSWAAANPVLAITLAVAALAAAVIANWDKIKPVLEAAWEKVKEVVDKVKEKVETAWNAIKETFETIKEKITGIFEDIKQTISDILDTIGNFLKEKINVYIGFINKLIGGINSMIDKINNLKLEPPKWAQEMFGIGTIGFNLRKIPEIPLLAKGGVVSDGGSAIVGEAGAEYLTVANGKATVQPLTNTNITNNYTSGTSAVEINFTGNLAQLARVLQPYIVADTVRRGA